MCGICGICSPSHDVETDRTVLEAMVAAMTHRGPDGDGLYFDSQVALGHRRLSIIDIAGGAQPMSSEDGSLVVVFNGEIYNYVELREDLKARGRNFRTDSDTEVILHQYAEAGPACVDAFNGMFAFALWDGRRRQLMLARDRLGEKPLYYRFDPQDGRLVFASELKSLVLHPCVKKRLALPALDDYLAYGYVPADRCILDGVNKLPPAARLLWQNGRISADAYWDVSFAGQHVVDEDQWLAEFEDRLRNAVRIRLRSDVPLGVFLSGGVDSSAIVSLAARESPRPLRTFTVGFDEPDYDEIGPARVVADHLGTDHSELIVRDRDVSILADLAYHLDEPFADPSALPTYYVCREAARHVKVCLSGDGGDEMLAGYTRYRQALGYQRFDRFALPGFARICGLVGGMMPRHYPGAGLLQRLAVRGADRYFALCAKFTPAERRALMTPNHAAAIQTDPWLFRPFFAEDAPQSLVSTLQHVDQKCYLPDDILVKVDRMAMKNSLEVRVPLLDHTLVEFLNHYAADWKLRNGATKYPLRKLLEPHLPPRILERRKMGFGIPIKHWFRGSLDGFFRDALLGADTRSTQWLDADAIKRVLEDHQRGGRDLSRKAWVLLMLELWCRRFGI